MTRAVPAALSLLLLAGSAGPVRAADEAEGDAPAPAAAADEDEADEGEAVDAGAGAAASGGQAPIYELPPTVVRGYRIRPTDDGAAFAETIEVTQQVTTVDSVSEVVSEAAGVQVRRLGGLGSYGAASIRGSTPGQVPVYLDGVLLNAGGHAAVNLGDLSLDTLETIEVYRGAAPMRYAAAGIGGAIVLRTRELKGPRTEVATSVGSWRTARVFALRGDRVGDQQLLAILSATTSRGDFEYFNDWGSPSDTDIHEISRRRNNQHLAVDGLIKLEGEVGDWRWTLANDLFVKEQGVPGAGAVREPTARLGTLRDSVFARLSAAVRDDLELDVGVSYLALREEYDDAEGAIGLLRQRAMSGTDAVGAEALAEYRPVGAHRLTARIDLRWEEFRHQDVLAGLYPEPKDRLRLALGAEYEWRPVPTLSLLPAVRLEDLYDHFGGGPVPGRVEEAIPAREANNIHASASLGVRFEVVPGLLLKANGGRYVRPPDLSEMFGDRGASVGNPDLRAEVGYNADLGFVVLQERRGPLSLLRFEVAGFGSWVEDLIVYLQDSQNTISPRNVSAAEVLGVETSFRLRLWRTLGLSGNYTYLHAIDQSDFKWLKGRRLPGRPVHEAYGQIELRLRDADWGLRLWGDVDYAGRNYLAPGGFQEDALARLLFGLGVRLEYRPAKLNCTLEVKNLLNDFVLTDEEGQRHMLRDFVGYPLPGRTVMLTLHWRS